MEEYFLYLINNFSLEIFLMSLVIFGATMLIKIPIKTATGKLDEAKRQGINTLIIFIPLVLAFIACLTYFWLTKKPILSLDYISCSLSICIMSISIYLIYARIVIVIKSVLTGKKNISMEKVCEEIDGISEQIKTEQKKESNDSKTKLQEIKSKINTLLNFKQELETQDNIQNLTLLNETNETIKHLEEEQANLLANKQ